jgi:hypothetical protein
VPSHIGIVQISHPGPTDESEHDDYWTVGIGSQVKAMYGALLGMTPIHIGYHKLVHEDGHIPEIGFEYSPDDARPRWPDPAHPQQVHMDIVVADPEAAEQLAGDHGARVLATFDDHRVLEDAIGHPFCLYGGGGATGEIARIVFDCADPPALAAFYEELFDMRTRVVNTPGRVEIAGGGHRVALAFQRSTCEPPAWPDPARPHQLHLDVVIEEPDGLERAVALGARHLPLPERPDNAVYADPFGHPHCMNVGRFDPAGHGPGQVEAYRRWLEEQSSLDAPSDG